MEIEQNIWGFTPDGEVVVLYTMRNRGGAYVRLTNIGAAIVAIGVPGRDGSVEDVVLGYNDWKSYISDAPAMGKSVGRYANRIAGGRFSLNGVEYNLPVNNGRNHLHGGPAGFGNRLWGSRVETDRVVFSLVSPDGDQGYPAELGVEVVYDWSDDNELEIGFYARCDGDTVVNLTNHAYFNLRGEGSGSVLGQLLQLNASNYLPTDEGQIPTGVVAPVADTPMDFREAKEIGRDIGAGFDALRIGTGYDHCWVVAGWQKGELAEVGSLYDPVSGRRMTVFSTQPGVQVYSGNWLSGAPMGKGGRRYGNRDGVAIECQGFPDAPNRPGFPSQVLTAGEIYNERIIYRFDVV